MYREEIILPLMAARAKQAGMPRLQGAANDEGLCFNLNWGFFLLLRSSFWNEDLHYILLRD